MARIPNEDELGQPGIHAPDVTPSYNVGEFTAPDRALEGLGGAIADVGPKVALGIGATIEKQDDFETAKNFVDFDLAQEKKLRQLQENPPENVDNMTTHYRTSYDTDARDFFKTVPAELKPKYDEMLVKRGDFYERRSFDFESSERQKQHVEAIDQSLLDLRNNTATNPDAYRENIARGIHILDAARLPGSAKIKARKAFAQGVEEDAVRARAANAAANGNLDLGEDLLRDVRRRPSDDNDGGEPQKPLVSLEPASQGGMSLLRTPTGANFVVAEGTPAARFRGAINDLIAAGVDIKGGNESGGFNDRNIMDPVTGKDTGVPSNHKSGHAIDINSSDNARGTKGAIDPDIALAIADKWGLKWGGTWKGASRDPMHFEIAKDAGPLPPEAADNFGADKVAQNDATITDAQTGVSTDVPTGGPAGVVYRHLSPQQRFKLDNVIRTQMRGVAQGNINQDIEHLRRTGETQKASDGRTSLERAAPFLTEMERTQAQAKWNEAGLEHTAISPLGDMSEDEGRTHIDTVINKAVEAGDEVSAAKVLTKANREYDRLQKARKDDPAGSVAQSPEVKAAFSAGRSTAKTQGTAVADGSPVEGTWNVSPQDAHAMVIEARLKAQTRLGILDPQPITKREALRTMAMAPISGPPTRQYRKDLNDAKDRFLQVYGPKYARAAFETGVKYLTKNNEQHDAAEAVARRLPESVERDDIFEAPTLPTSAAPARPQPSVTIASSTSMGQQNLPAPPPKALAELHKNPGLADAFSAKYGPAALAEALKGY